MDGLENIKLNDQNQRILLSIRNPIVPNSTPTQKPIGLLRKIIPDNTKIGDFIYDPFLGSGSTAIACEHLGRKSICIELDEEYVGIIIKRLEKLTGEKAIKI